MLEVLKWLDGIIKGRYVFEIDLILNFVMRDNFNGGERRSIDILFGGEIFLIFLLLVFVFLF